VPTPMETEISRTFSALRDCWSIKLPDVPRFQGSTMRANIPRPFDYITLCRDGVVGIECKQTKNKTSLPLGNISEHQVEALREFARLGGYAYLLVNFRLTSSKPKRNIMFALSSEQCYYWYSIQQERRSIPFRWMSDNCVAIPRIRLPNGQYGWDIRVLAPFSGLDFYRGGSATLL